MWYLDNGKTVFMNKHHAFLCLQQLMWGYQGKSLVDDPLTVVIPEGELVVILGRNGSGKSSLLRVLSGLQPPLSGTVTFDGHPVRPDTVAMVFPNRSYVPFMKVRDLIVSVKGLSVFAGRRERERAFEQAEEVLTRVQLTGYSHRLLDSLSDGEYRKVMIGAALARGARLVFLDEPTAFLDYESRIHLLELLQELTQQQMATVMMTSHEPELSAIYAHRIWTIRDRMVEQKAGGGSR
jgi:iron complex transport system ATP-binding protein